MTIRPKKPSRLMSEMTEMADAMHANGTMDDATHAEMGKITMRDLNRAEAATLATPSAEEIRALRERAHMSQAVFAHTLNLTTSYIAQLERGARRPAGAALKLLDLIRAKGIEAVL